MSSSDLNGSSYSVGMCYHPYVGTAGYNRPAPILELVSSNMVVLKEAENLVIWGTHDMTKQLSQLRDGLMIYKSFFFPLLPEA